MGNDVKIVDQNPISVVQADSVQPQTPVQPVSSVGGASKEIGRVSEFAKPSGAEIAPNIPPEVSEANVEVKSDKPDLTFEHKQLGVDHAGPSAPFPNQPSGSIKLPMSEEEIESQLKTGQDDDSGKWLAGLIQKIIKAMGL